MSDAERFLGVVIGFIIGVFLTCIMFQDCKLIHKDGDHLWLEYKDKAYALVEKK